MGKKRLTFERLKLRTGLNGAQRLNGWNGFND
jgi:hypothetical protein